VNFATAKKAILLTTVLVLTVAAGWSKPNPESTSWYFAVSGDSRDCGDLIMPKIAQAIADNRKNAPVEFYWHLGDLRAIYRRDCDMAMREDPSFQCPPKFLRDEDPAVRDKYLSAAWPDYISQQIKPFETRDVPFYLGIGNHELIAPKTRDEFRQQFKEWLTKPTLQKQRASDRKKGIASNDGETYFHFVWKGVDIIYLDNASIYDDQNPWPFLADGQGYTVELADPLANLCDGSNYFAGCFGGSPGTEFIPCITSVEASASISISVYPNPAGDFFLVETSSSEVNFTLFDFSGRKILEKQLENQKIVTVNVSTLEKGIYWYQVTDREKNIKTGKVIIQ